MANFEPKIISFACNWCTSAGADLAGTSRMEYLPNSKAFEGRVRSGIAKNRSGARLIRHNDGGQVDCG